mgnify:CR=1 FL=1
MPRFSNSAHYIQKRLSERIRGHLLLCRVCAAKLLYMRIFFFFVQLQRTVFYIFSVLISVIRQNSDSHYLKILYASYTYSSREPSHHTVPSLFCIKIQPIFPEKIVDFLGWKTREKVVVLDFLAVDNFDFTRKNVKKNWVKNSWKCICGFCQNWIFGQIYGSRRG